MIMFEEDKAEYLKFFDFYKKKFKEEVGLVPSVFENDDFEIDLAVGEDTGKIHGIRVMQIVPRKKVMRRKKMRRQEMKIRTKKKKNMK